MDDYKKQHAEKMRKMGEDLIRSAEALMSGGDGRAERDPEDSTVDPDAMDSKKEIKKNLMVAKLKKAMTMGE